MLALVVAHLVLAALLPMVSARSTRAAFALAALLPAGTLVWAVSTSLATSGGVLDETTAWAPAIGLNLSFHLDALALAMIVLVSGIGAVILWYCVGYFGPDSPQASRTAALLLAFAGAMLGLVLAADLLTLYVFWELTSVASFLLVGQAGAEPAERRAAVQALLVTVFGGLAMLLGFVLLGQAAGTFVINEILADPPQGGLVPVALPLILLGAFTKSAQLPFHPWLPAAMVAPTPVSAYLHAASMVKAGVYLVARLAPGFADQMVWWLPVVVFGLGTMMVGGWRALAENDLKRLLAFGTVSQLGFLIVLFGAGSRTAGLAGITMLLAHGLFKAPLFLTVGTIDHATGTRDVRKLSGLGRALPATAVAASLAAASMAGLPPLLGFVGKEAAFTAFEELPVVFVGLVAGSALTVAYTARFLWGAFATKPGVDRTPVHHAPGVSLAVPVWLTALAGLVLGVAYPVVDELAEQEYGSGDYYLALWHGFEPALFGTTLAIAGGLLIHRFRSVPERLSRRSPVSAQRGYQHVVNGLTELAVVVTGRLQVGSLPVYLGVILATVILLPGLATVLWGTWPTDQSVYDAVLQVPLGAAVVVAALALTRARRRFTAVLLVGVIGYGVGGLFIVDGAPDLALAQFLVETLSLVAFVFVLRRLPGEFTERRTTRRGRLPRLALAALGGITVAGIAVVLSAARTDPATTSAEFARLAPTEAGATNVVSAIIVDFRAMDTVGEIGVLFIAAAGVASLVLAARYDIRQKDQREKDQREKDQREQDQREQDQPQEERR